jgi:hypothetical protein
MAAYTNASPLAHSLERISKWMGHQEGKGYRLQASAIKTCSLMPVPSTHRGFTLSEYRCSCVAATAVYISSAVGGACRLVGVAPSCSSC